MVETTTSAGSVDLTVRAGVMPAPALDGALLGLVARGMRRTAPTAVPDKGRTLPIAGPVGVLGTAATGHMAVLPRTTAAFVDIPSGSSAWSPPV